METMARAPDQSHWVRGETTVSMAREGQDEMTPPKWVSTHPLGWVSTLQCRAEQGEGKEEIKEKQAGKVLPSVTQNQRSRNTHTLTHTYIYTHI